MKHVVLGVVTVAALSGTASAGTYLGLGIGTSPALSQDLSEAQEMDSGSRSLKGLVGYRFNPLSFGSFSIEGALGGNSVIRANTGGVFVPYGDLYHVSAAAKFSLPLGSGFEAFGRAGLQHTKLKAEQADASVSGNGFLIGAGFEYRFRTGIGGASIFVDYQINRTNLVGDTVENLEYSLTTRTWMLGLTIGI